MFEFIILIGIVALVYIFALLMRAFANKNNICPLCKQKIGMNSIITSDKRVVCLKCCRKAGIKLHNTRAFYTVEEIKNILNNQ